MEKNMIRIQPHDRVFGPNRITYDEKTEYIEERSVLERRAGGLIVRKFTYEHSPGATDTTIDLSHITTAEDRIYWDADTSLVYIIRSKVKEPT